MEVLYPRCAGLDVHKKTGVACVRIQQGQSVEQEVRTFETTTSARDAGHGSKGNSTSIR